MRRLTDKTREAVIDHAIGSFYRLFYRLNAQSADCYAFTLDYYNGKPSWQGGWDWVNKYGDKWEVQVGKDEKYILLLNDKNRIVKQGEVK